MCKLNTQSCLRRAAGPSGVGRARGHVTAAANGGAPPVCARTRAVASAPAMAAAGLPEFDLSQIKTRSVERTLLPLIKQVRKIRIQNFMRFLKFRIMRPLSPQKAWRFLQYNQFASAVAPWRRLDLWRELWVYAMSKIIILFSDRLHY